MLRAPRISSLFFGFFLMLSFTDAQQPRHFDQFSSTANLSTTWTNYYDFSSSITYRDGSMTRVILVEGSFGCAFFCYGDCTSYLFVILILRSEAYHPERSAVIWSANPDYPVREGATLNLIAAGDLVLSDVDGSIVWTTNTTGKSTVGMKLNGNGNIVLFDGHNSSVWQSFDHPTDSLVIGQQLFEGQKLTTKDDRNNSYHLQVTNRGLFAYIGSNPPQVYYRYLLSGRFYAGVDKRSYLELDSTGHLNFDVESNGRWIGIIPPLQPQYIKLMPDGHLKAFGKDSKMIADLLTDDDLGECSYPLACGRNSICSVNKQCGSPMGEYFKAVNDLRPNMGFSRVTPLTCNATHHQHFIQLKNVTYFTKDYDMENMDLETCKQECLRNCSCQAVLFKYGPESSTGYCYLPSELFTMTKDDAAGVFPYNGSAFIKVQNAISTLSSTKQSQNQSKSQVARVVGAIIGGFVLLLIVVIGLTRLTLKKQKEMSDTEEEYLDQVSGRPTRFSYQEMKIATQNFSKKLGEGGYGSVFQGSLEDGSQIAVKCLQGLVHVKKSFLAEVESIGNIHHVNLVPLLEK